MGPPPGPLAEVLGVEVVEHDMLRGDAGNRVTLGDAEYRVGGFCSVLELRGAEAVASYEDEYYAGTPAVTRRGHGAGRAYFLGATAGPELYGGLLEMALRDSGLRPHPWSSETVETIPLQTVGDEPPLTFVLNHGAQSADLDLGEGTAYRDLLTGREHSGRMRLDGYGVVLLAG
jgi:beta-galactosidase